MTLVSPAFEDQSATAQTLSTVADFVRYAVSSFQAANLTYGHGTDNAFDDAVYLVLETLHLPIDNPEPFWNARLLPAERALLASRIEERVQTRRPTPYVVNRAYIQGVPFYVDDRVIVPRSYLGELLFSETLFDLLPFADDVGAVTRVLDLCTGSGCLAILAAGVFPNAKVDAVDLSADAVNVARKNIADHDLEDRVSVYHGDLFAPLVGQRYDLILTNPPYVDAAAMAALPPEYRAEPAMALAGGDDGMDLVRKILAQAPDHLTPEGGVLAEIGTGRSVIEQAYPHLPMTWLDSENSQSEVFWVTRSQLSK